MKKNPSSDAMIVPSPLGALFCMIYELLLGLLVVLSHNKILITIFCILDISLIKMVLAFIMLYRNLDKLLLLFLVWGYHFMKKKTLCYVVIPGIRCCKNGDKIWSYALVRDG